MSHGRRGWFAVVLLAAMACHRPREMAPQIPLEGIDGKYSFTVRLPTSATPMEGRFVVAYSRVYLIEPRRCVPTEGPKSSDEMRSAWFECTSGAQAKPGDAFLRLRISEVDPINRSRWYSRTRELDTVLRCTGYNTNGDCVELLRARGMKWVERNGAITVEKGFPVQPDTGAVIDPNGRGRLRVRCDTSAVSGACIPETGRTW